MLFPQISSFAIYTAWLAAFAMSGPLLNPGLLLYFLIPHVLAALVFTHPRTSRLFGWLLPPAIWVTALGTAFYPFSGAAGPLLVALLGLTSMPLSLRVLMALKETAQPVRSAVIALTLGHLLMLLVVNVLPDPLRFGPPFLALLLVSLAFATPVPARFTQGAVPGIARVLWAIFFFQVLSGLMYGGLFPAFAEQGLWVETHWVMLFYPLGALLALMLMRFNRTLALIVGVLIALVGFSSWRVLPEPLGANLGMASTLFAAGLVDLVFLAHVLSFNNQLRAGGYGLAVLCGGILLGKGITFVAPQDGELIGLIGLAMLNLSIIVLYLMHQQSLPAPDPRPADQPKTGQIAEETLAALPFFDLLSDQERTVLPHLAGSAPYREIACSLNLAESTIKTYAQRIYRKAGVYNRRQLREHLTDAKPQS